MNSISWSPPGVSLTRACPICDHRAKHRVLLKVIDGLEREQTLLLCDACTTRFYSTLEPLDYEDELYPELYSQFYLEQNADLHHITRLLFLVEPGPDPSLLDIGCGFGIAVIMADCILGWRACGLDPSSKATEARELTGCDIRTEYLTKASKVGRPFSLITASEVIEHVPDPYAFLDLVRPHLQPGGVLVLTTPDADGVSPAMEPDQLLQILAPGGHMMLFTAASLERCLRRAGFAHIDIERRGPNLTAICSDRPLRRQTDPHIHHRTFMSMLRVITETSKPGSPLWNGSAGKLYRHLAGGGDFIAADTLYATIAAAWRTRFAIDLLNPEALPGPDAEDGDIWRFIDGAPFNLAGVILARARLEAIRPGSDRLKTLAWRRAAVRCASATRYATRRGALEDLELQQITWEARAELVQALTAIAPELEGTLTGSLAKPTLVTTRFNDPAPGFLIPRFAARFIELVHSGNYTIAADMTPIFDNLDAVCLTLGHNLEQLFHVLYCLAVVDLNGRGNPQAAAVTLRRLEVESGRGESPLERHFLEVAQQLRVKIAAE